MKNKELLDILTAERIHGVLEEVIQESDLYITAQNEHDKACEELEKVNLTEDQKKIINNVISTANYCGSMYGAVAYRQGLDDGIELIWEILKVLFIGHK